MIRSKCSLSLYRQIVMLHALQGFYVLVLTVEAIAVALTMFRSGNISSPLIWIGLFAFILICVLTTDGLIKYKMREYAEEKLDLRNMKLTDSLLNCDKCGSIPRYIISPGSFMRGLPPTVSISCTSCGCRGVSYDNAAQAVHEWNAGNVRH